MTIIRLIRSGKSSFKSNTKDIFVVLFMNKIYNERE